MSEEPHDMERISNAVNLQLLNIFDPDVTFSPPYGWGSVININNGTPLQEGGVPSLNLLALINSDGVDTIGVSSGPVQPGRGYTGDGFAYITIDGLLTTDTITADSTDVPTCTIDGQLDIASGDVVYGVSVERSGENIGYYPCSEGFGSIAVNLSVSVSALANGVISDNSIHTEITDGTGYDLNQAGFSNYQKSYWQFLSPVYPDYTPTGSTYYIRNDGTATTLAAAVDKSVKSGALNVSNWANVADQVQPGDTVVFSAIGGNIGGNVYLLAGGTDTSNRVTYINDPEYPNAFIRTVKVLNGYMDIIDFEVNAPSYSSGLSLTSQDALFVDNIVGVRTYNCRLINTTNQGVQHDTTNSHVEAKHYNLYTAGNADEGLSIHGTADVEVHGGVLRDGCNWTSVPTLKIYDAYIAREGQILPPIEIPTSVRSELTVERCHIVDSVSGTTYRLDIRADSNIIFRDNCFYNIPPDQYVVVFRDGITSAIWTNNYISDGANQTRTKAFVYNASSIVDMSGCTYYTEYDTIYTSEIGDTSDTTIKANIIHPAALGSTTIDHDGDSLQYAGRLKYTLATVSGTSWDNYVLKAPVCPDLINADDGTLFTAGVANELSNATWRAWSGDQFWSSDDKEEIAIYATVQVDPSLTKINKYFGVS